LRTNDRVAHMGNLSGASVFLSAPWGTPDLSAGRPQFLSPMQLSLSGEVEGYTGLQSRFFTGADVAAFGAKRLTREPMLLCIIRGETTELILLGEKNVEGYATIPTGFFTVLRTLRAHGGLSDSEVRSAFLLAQHPDAAPS